MTLNLVMRFAVVGVGVMLVSVSKTIRLMVYLPSGAPAADHVARRNLQWRWGSPGGWQLPDEPVGGRLVEFQRHWEAIIREWSERWGRDVSGWWID